MSISWGTVAGSFLAPYIYGLFWKRTTKWGAYAGMGTGLILSNGLYWYWFVTESPAEAGTKAPLAASIAMIVPMLVVPAVSVFTPPPKTETIDKAFRSNGNKGGTFADTL
jgi:SSS family solute:Na+ symporter